MDHDGHDNAGHTSPASSARVRTIAMVGATANDVRPSYFAMKYLLGKGYRVHPVNPGLAGKTILGQPVFARSPKCRLRSTSSTSSAARRRRRASREAIRLDPLPKVIWMQLGVRNDEAAASRGGRPQGGHEPLPEDRVRPPVRRDRLGRRQFAGAVVEEADPTAGLPEFRRPRALTRRWRAPGRTLTARPAGWHGDVFAMFADAGLSGAAVFVCPDIQVAEVGRLGQRKGRVKAGDHPDLVVVDGNSQADPVAANGVRTVIRGGGPSRGDSRRHLPHVAAVTLARPRWALGWAAASPTPAIFIHIPLLDGQPDALIRKADDVVVKRRRDHGAPPGLGGR